MRGTKDIVDRRSVQFKSVTNPDPIKVRVNPSPAPNIMVQTTWSDSHRSNFYSRVTLTSSRLLTLPLTGQPPSVSPQRLTCRLRSPAQRNQVCHVLLLLYHIAVYQGIHQITFIVIVTVHTAMMIAISIVIMIAISIIILVVIMKCI